MSKLKEARILLVDDDQRELFILQRTLKKLPGDYTVVPAHGSREALEKAQAGPCVLLLTDLRMPHMNGVHLTERFLEMHPEASVMWITAHGCHWVREDAERLGVARCLNKPMEVADIRQAVLDVLHATPSSNGSGQQGGK